MAPCRRPEVRRSRRQHSRCRHPIPASPLFGHSRSPRSLVPEFPLVSSPVRPPLRNREVGTLSDSALEPSSRCPAPTMNQQFLDRFEDLGLVSPRALSLCERTNLVFVLPLLVAGRGHPKLRPMRSLVSERRPFDDRADDRTVGSIVKGHVPKREGSTTDVETPPLASQPFRRKASLRIGVSGRYEPRVRCRLRASATVIRASHLRGDLPGRMRRECLVLLSWCSRT